MIRKTFAPYIIYILCFLLISLFALIYYISSVREEKIILSVLHTDVLYGKIHPELVREGTYKDQYRGGSALISSLINDLRQETADRNGVTVLVDAGNSLFEGNSVPYKRGKTVIKIMNHIKYDAMTLGNGELDYGISVLKQTMQEANFPLLAANVVEEKTEQRPSLLKPYVLKKYEGLTIGVLGLTNPQMKEICLPELTEGWKFLDYEEITRQYIKEMREKGADFIIVLNDLWGVEREKNLARMFPNDIHLIVGTSKTLGDVYESYMVGTVPMVKTPRGVKSVGQFIFEIDRKSKKILSQKWVLHPVVSSRVEPDVQVHSIIADEAQYIEQKMNSIVYGEVTEDLPYELLKEGAFGNLICDIVMKKVPTDVVMINSAALRGHAAGNVTEETLSSSIPYDNDVVTMVLKGRQIKEILEKSFEQIPEFGILQVAGIKMKYDLTLPYGERVWEIFIGDTPLVEEADYTVATISFLQTGGDNFDTFTEGRNIINYFDLKSMVKQFIIEEGLITSQLNQRTVEEKKPLLAAPLPSSPPPLDPASLKVKPPLNSTILPRKAANTP